MKEEGKTEVFKLIKYLIATINDMIEMLNKQYRKYCLIECLVLIEKCVISVMHVMRQTIFLHGPVKHQSTSSYVHI